MKKILTIIVSCNSCHKRLWHVAAFDNKGFGICSKCAKKQEEQIRLLNEKQDRDINLDGEE